MPLFKVGKGVGYSSADIYLRHKETGERQEQEIGHKLFDVIWLRFFYFWSTLIQSDWRLKSQKLAW